LQEAAVVGLKFPQSYYDELLEIYTKKRDLFLDGLKRIGLVFNEPQGAYYVMIDISQFGYDDDLEFCEKLAEKVGIGAVPGSSFFKEDVNHLIRLHFAKTEKTLTEALERLKGIKVLLK
jgi:aminotransferase